MFARNPIQLRDLLCREFVNRCIRAFILDAIFCKYTQYLYIFMFYLLDDTYFFLSLLTTNYHCVLYVFRVLRKQ